MTGRSLVQNTEIDEGMETEEFFSMKVTECLISFQIMNVEPAMR